MGGNSYMPRLMELYLELALVVPKDCKSAREIQYERCIREALSQLDFATPKQRNGPTYRAADVLRKALGKEPSRIGESFVEGL